MPETTFHEYFAPPLPTIPDPSIKGIEFRLNVLPHLLPTPLPPFGGPNSSTDQTIRTIRFQLTRSVETRLYRRARGGRPPRGLFSIRCRAEEIRWEGVGPIRAGKHV